MVAKFLVMVAFTLSNLTYLVTPGKEFNCSRDFKVSRVTKLLSSMYYLCFIRNSSEVISRHLPLQNGYACILCTSCCAPVLQYVVRGMACLAHEQLDWVCSTCTYHPWICWFEVNSSLASMHYGSLMGGNAEFCFEFYLQYDDNHFLQKSIDTFHMQKYLIFLSKHTYVCACIFTDTGEDKSEFASTW